MKSWLFEDAPTAAHVLAAWLRGEESDTRRVRHALESLLAAWDDASMLAERCHDKLGLPRARRVSRRDLEALAEAVRIWDDRLSEEPMDTDLAEAAEEELAAMRPGR